MGLEGHTHRLINFGAYIYIYIFNYKDFYENFIFPKSIGVPM